MIYRNGIYYDRMIRNGVTYDRMVRNGVMYGGSNEPPVGRVFNVGTGSGNLTINGATLGDGLVAGDKVQIAAGTYTSITIQNISVATGHVEVLGLGSTIINVNNLNISNAIGADIHSIILTNNTNRGVVLSNTVKRLKLHDLNLTDITNHGIHYNGSAVVTDGINSPIDDIEIYNCSFDNGGNIYFEGYWAFDGLRGLVKNINIHHNTFENCDNYGSLVEMANVDGFEIHHNIVKNINQTVTPGDMHARLLFAKGSRGSIHHNYGENIYGNLCAIWCLNRSGQDERLIIHNNIVYNSLYYSLGEFQTPADYIVSGVTTFANPEAYFNTAVNMAMYWEDPGDALFSSVVLDIYQLRGGVVTSKNNVAVRTAPSGNQWQGYDYVNNPSGYENSVNTSEPTNLPPHQAGDGSTPPLYPFSDITDAGIEDTISFRPIEISPLTGAGSAITGITTDFHDDLRPNPPTIGAVES